MRCWSTCNRRSSGAGTAHADPPPFVQGELQFQELPDWGVVVGCLCSQHVDTQKELLEELYEDKLNNLKESLTDYYQEEIQVCSGQWCQERGSVLGEDFGYLSPGRWLMQTEGLGFLRYIFVVLFDSLSHNFSLSTALCSSLDFLIFRPSAGS